MRWHYVPSWKDDKHLIRGYQANPGNGPIFIAVDWGGTNPARASTGTSSSARGRGRYLASLRGPYTRRLKEGTLVAFDEIYIAEIGNEKLG